MQKSLPNIQWIHDVGVSPKSQAKKNISLSESRNLDLYVQILIYMIVLFLYLWAINQTWQFSPFCEITENTPKIARKSKQAAMFWFISMLFPAWVIDELSNDNNSSVLCFKWRICPRYTAIQCASEGHVTRARVS